MTSRSHSPATASASRRSASHIDDDKNTAPIDLTAYARRMHRKHEDPHDDDSPTVPIDLSEMAGAPAARPPHDPRRELPSLVDVDVEVVIPVDEARVSEPPTSGTRSRTGPSPALNQVPYLAVSKPELASYDLDATSLSVAKHIDGELTVQSLLARAGLPWRDVLRVLGELTLRGAIRFR